LPVLISIELLGCSTVMVSFIGFSISKIDVLHHDSQMRLTQASWRYAYQGGWLVEVGRGIDGSMGAVFRITSRTYIHMESMR